MTTKIIFSVLIGILLGVCVWSYRISNVDNTTNSKETELKEEGDKK